MSNVYLKKGDRYLEVKVGWSFTSVSGRVKLKEVGKEVALRRAEPVFDLEQRIDVLWAGYRNALGSVSVVPVFRQGSTQAEVKTYRCNPSTVFKNARELLELHA